MSHSQTNHLSNPFVGLRAFEEREDYLFFGRGKQISELLKKFRDSRFLAVIGSSGSGKSSLVKSGLLPAIYSGFMTVGSNWRVALMRPGENPMGYLAKELAGEGTLYSDVTNRSIPYDSIIESSLRRSENGLVQVYKDAHLDARENLLIVVDQFEELFRFNKYEKETTPGKSDAIHFIQILLAAVRQTGYPIYILLTMRSDFLGDCAEFRGLPEAINEGQYLVPRMIRDEIREAITGPVAVSTAKITQRLVTRLLNDVNNDTDQLPILQHAMMRTWDAWYKRDQPDTPIDFEDYETIGTMKSALSQHADEAYAELATQKDQYTCELMFKALTDNAADVRGIRRPRSVADLCLLTGATQEEVVREVEIFRKPGRTFLMPPRDVELTDASIIDISHESLMRVWERLVVWTEEEARSGDIYLRLADSAKLREQGERGLLKNPELELALNWKEKNKPNAKWAEGYKANFEQAMAYLENSRREDLAEKKFLADKEATRKRLRNAIFALLGFLLIASVITAIYFNDLRRQAANSAKVAIQKQREADSSAKVAIQKQQEAANSAKIAVLKQQEADISANVAVLKQLEADSSAREADINAKIAVLKQREADSSAKIAVLNRQEAITEKQNAIYKNLKIAANEYARLIREGPSDENKNKNEFYGNNYFLAYQYHFDQLEDSTAKEDAWTYKSLQNKLYYNNDLYQRVYENLEKIGERSLVVREDKTANPDYDLKLADINIAKDKFKINEKGKLTLFSSGKTDTATAQGQEFVSFAVSKSQQRLFCSTNDNLIYVFDNKLNRIDAINMGTKVTALDFNDERNRSLLYFGTSGGYIGYIDYGKDRKNQPVFENKLESEITAIQVFKHTYTDRHAHEVKETFLLAAGLKSSPRVYKLDNNTLRPDALLLGNMLPYTEKEYGRIIQAGFNKNDRVVLVTSKGTRYLWNPFTHDLLDKLTASKKFNPGTEPAKSLINKPETKFY